MHNRASEDVAAVWMRVREELEASVPANAYKLWLEPLRPVSASGTTLYLAAPREIRAWVERRYSARIVAALRDCAPSLGQVGFLDAIAADPGDAEAESPSAGFGDFVIGGSNRFAHAAALAVAEIPGEAYNPLFLYGAPGVGKTHLLTAIADYLRRQHPGMTVRLTTAEAFTSEFVTAVRSGKGQRFKDTYRDVDALLVDDVQFLEDKAQTGEEFFHTFNSLHERGRQIVLSSDRAPRELARLTERLRDRFEWGLCAPVETPEMATRLSVTTRLAAAMEPSFDPPENAAVLREIAARCSNLRQVEGALTRVVAFTSMMSTPATPALVRDLIASHGETSGWSDDPDSRVTVEAIQNAACDVFRISNRELLSKSRTPKVARARQLAIYVARQRLSLSFNALATAFGRDKSTILHSIRTVEKELGPGTTLHAALERMLDKLSPTPAGGRGTVAGSGRFPTTPGAFPPDQNFNMSRTHGGSR